MKPLKRIWKLLQRAFCCIAWCDGYWYEPCKRCGKPIDPNY